MGRAELVRQLKHAAEYWKTDGPFWLARVAATKVVDQLYPVLPPVTYKSLHMLLRLGYWPNIRKPRTFNEKVVHRQLLAQHPLASLIADKWRVRQYVAERGLAHILNEVYFVTDDPEKIPFDDLPDRFVIKANHGCSWNILVTDKRTLDRRKAIRKCRKWLSLKYGKSTRQYDTHYDTIPPLILVERFIEEEERAVPVDYKFYCFHGSALFIEVHLGRFAKHTENFYDREWREAVDRSRTPRSEGVPKPPRLAEMLQVAERLSGDFDFCRVDLYSPNAETILFGEITLSPSGGLDPICREWGYRLGELW